MTLEDYERTPYGIHMSAEDLYYQAVLFFFLGDRVIGSMGLFHTKEEGGFREEERGLLEYLAELVEANYQNYLRHSGEARFHDSFQLFFQDVKMGAVILNQDMTVMQTNKAAQEISQIFWEQYRHNQGHFLRSNYQGDPQVPGGPDHDQRDQRASDHPGRNQSDLHFSGRGHHLFITPRFSPPARRA